MSMTSSVSLLLLKSFVSLGLLAGGASVFLLLGKAKSDADQERPENLRLVEVQPAAPHTAGITFAVDGVVVPYREVKLAAEVAGRVIEKAPNLRIGRIVRKGDPLVLVDRRDYELEKERLQEQLKQAEGNLAELDVQIQSTLGQIDLAQQNLEIQARSTQRIRSLVARNATTESSLDDAMRAELTAQTTLQTQRDQLALLRASKARLENARNHIQTELASAELQLSRTTISSPINGIVVEDHVEQDSYLQKGTAVCTIRDTAKLEIVCSLQTNQMKWLWETNTGSTDARPLQAYELPETPVTVRYRIGNDELAWDGIISRYDGAKIDQQTRMIPCRVQVSDPLEVRHVSDDGQVDRPVAVPTLMVGMYVAVDIHVNPQSQLVRIPKSALYPGNRLWVVVDEKLERREVNVALAQDDSVLVYARQGQIQPGEAVVVSPLAAPFHGASIQVVE